MEPGDVLYLEYVGDKETLAQLQRGTPPGETRLGKLLEQCGFKIVKDWYFPEGGLEGGMLLNTLTPDELLTAWIHPSTAAALGVKDGDWIEVRPAAPKVLEQLKAVGAQNVPTARFKVRVTNMIFTGTPPGVGHSKGKYLRGGDVVEAEVEGVGRLRNYVVEE